MLTDPIDLRVGAMLLANMLIDLIDRRADAHAIRGGQS